MTSTCWTGVGWRRGCCCLRRPLPQRFSCRTFCLDSPPKRRPNSFGVELLPEAYQTRLFQFVRSRPLDRAAEAQALRDLERFGLISAGRTPQPSDAAQSSAAVPDITLLLPPLAGRNVEEHFQAVGEELVRPYRDLLDSLLGPDTVIPPPPADWRLQPGWVRWAVANSGFFSPDHAKNKFLLVRIR